MNEELVSVVIPTFGRADLLPEAINSVINQTYDNIEIYVVDDNGLGTQNQKSTEKQIRNINSEKVKYLPLPKNSGGAFARNYGANIAKGDYICFLDDDDCFLPDKVERQLRAIRQNPNAVACYCGHIRDNKILNSKVKYEPTMRGDCRYAVMTFAVDFCSGSTLMVKKSAYERVGGFDVALKRFQDYQFLAQISCLGDIECVTQPLTIINTHAGSYSLKSFAQIEKNRSAYLRSIKNAIETLSPTDQKKVYDVNNSFLFKEAVRFKEFKAAAHYLKCAQYPTKLLATTIFAAMRFFVKTHK